MVGAMIMKEMPESHAPGSHVCVFVREMTVKMRIGLHASEAEPQRVVVGVRLYADPLSYLRGVSAQSIIDYQRIHDAVQEWPKRPHVKLIETCVRELLDLSFSISGVMAAHVSVSKPDIFPAAEGAGVEVFMTRDDYKKL